MLTDDDLTRELSAAFQAATADLAYTGRTRPPRRAGAALPAAVGSAVAVVVAAAAVAAGFTGTAGPSRPAAAGPTTPGPATAGPTAAHPSATKPALVTETFSLAGFRITYQRTAGQPDPVIAELVAGGLPAGVREVHLAGSKARVWAGQDPRTGDNALYIKAPARTGGRLFVLLSATWTEKQLIGLVTHPRPVPLVSPGHSGSPS